MCRLIEGTGDLIADSSLAAVAPMERTQAAWEGILHGWDEDIPSVNRGPGSMPSNTERPIRYFLEARRHVRSRSEYINGTV